MSRAADMPEARSLVEVLRWRAVHRADAPAYTFLPDDGDAAEPATLTFAGIEQRARVVAGAMQAAGAQPGDRALLLFPNGLDYIAAFFGCLSAGIVAVPAYPPGPHRPVSRLRAIAADATPRFGLSGGGIHGWVTAQLADEPDLQALRWLDVDAQDGGAADSFSPPEIGPRSLAFLQYTSGSTSTPKGVMVSHANLLANERMLQQAFGHDEQSTYVSWLPLFHDMGLIGNVLQTLFCGSHSILLSPLSFLADPHRWLRAISDHRAHTSGAPNFGYDLCVRKIAPERRADLDLSSWRVAYNGSEPVHAQTLDAFAEAFAAAGLRRESLYPCYGLAEATLFVSGGLRAEPPLVAALQPDALERNRVSSATDGAEARRVVGCGRTWLDQRIEIVDPETREPCEPSRVGEIWLAGPHICDGYWNRPDATDEAFRARLAGGGEGPFLRTGDLGFLRGGELFVTGRLKDLIIVRGRNHYPQDIELSAEHSHPALRAGRGAAFAVTTGGEERVVLVAELDRGHADEDLDAVTQAIRRGVSRDHEVELEAVVLIEPGSLPKTSSGKVARRPSRDAYLAGRLDTLAASTLRRTAPSAPAGSSLLGQALRALEPQPRRALLESHLRDRVAGLLGVAPGDVDPAEPVTALGMDSLRAVELQHALESELDVQLSTAAVLGAESIAALAALLADAVTAPAEPTPGTEIAATESAPSSADGLGVLPLSEGQRALWLSHQIAPSSAAYNVSRALHIHSPLDVAALRRALQGWIDRHPSLRTSYALCDGEPSARVRSAEELCFECVEAADWTAAQLTVRLADAANAPFDLERGPLLRVHLYALADGTHVLLLAFHHIAVDLWSLIVLMEELAERYDAHAAGRPPPALPELPSPVSVARAQAAGGDGPASERDADWWIEQLRGVPSLDLPADHRRPPVQTSRGGSEAFHLPPALVRRVEALARSEATTVYVTLLAAFQVLLCRTSGQTDFAIGSPLAGRGAAQLRSWVGYLVDMAPLRADLGGHPSFRELLRRTRSAVLGALEHPRVPFARLVRELEGRRDPSRSPLFQVAFALERPHALDALSELVLGESGARTQLGGLEIEPIALEARDVPFDLTLAMAEARGGLAASLQYNADLFDRDTAARLAAHFARLLEGLVDQPDRPVSAASLLDAAERARLLGASAVATHAASPVGQNVHVRFASHAAARPDAPAIRAGGRTLSYGALDARAEALADRLRALGVGREVRVAVLLERSVELVVAVLGVLKAGGAYVPLDPESPRERLAFALDDSGSVALLSHASLDERTRGLAVPVLRVEADAGTDGVARPTVAASQPAALANGLAYAIYTSGSTGQPKAVLVSHDALANLVDWHIRAYTVESGDRGTLVASPSFDASVWELWPYLASGACVCIPDAATRTALPRLLAWLAEEAVTIAFLPTPLAEAALDEPWPDGTALRALLTGGDRLRQRPRRELPFRLVNHYGPTESCVVATCGAVAPAGEGRGAPSIGRAIDGVRVHLLDASLEPVPVGVVGELYLGGRGLARGYAGRAALTGERFVPDPFSAAPGERLYRTGDLARYRRDGAIEYLGRSDEQLKVRGFRIEPGEIEAALRAHPDVGDAAVVAEPSRSAAHAIRLTAYWTPGRANATDEAAPTASTLREFLAERLPSYMIPSAFVALDALPVSASGKLDRRALPAPSPYTEGSSDYEPPRDDREALLAKLWCEVLGVAQVGIRDNFFALGGDSIAAIKVAARALRAGIELRPEAIFRHQTIAALPSGGLAPALPPRAARSAADAPTSPLPLTPMQQGLLFHSLYDADSGVYLEQLHCAAAPNLDVGAFQRAWREVLARHEALRASFRWQDEGAPHQVLEASVELPFEVCDLRALARPEAEAALAQRLADDRTRGFDLARAPLMRCALFQLPGGRLRLLWTVHHLLLDGWSTGLVLAEVLSRYEAHGRGESPPEGETPRPLRDYLDWLDGRDHAAAESHWTAALAGFARPNALGAREDAQAATTRYDERTLTLSATATRALEALARGARVTLATVLEGAWAGVLSRASGDDDVCFGTTVSGRPPELEGVEEMVGLFINTLPLRARLDRGTPVEDWLRALQLDAAEAVRHSHASLARIQGWSDVPRGVPLFESVLVFENLPLDAALARSAALALERGEHLGARTNYPLTLLAVPGEALRVRAVYETARFDGDAVERLLRDLAQLLEAFAATPQAPLGALPLLNPETLAIAATFTADPVLPPLAWWLRWLDLPYRAVLGPYAQVIQQLLDPASALSRAPVGVVLVRLDDWLPQRDGAPDAGALARAAEDLIAAVSTAAQRGASSLLVVFCPPSPEAADTPGCAAQLAELECEAEAALCELPGVRVLRSSALDARYPIAQSYDVHADALGHVPYTEAGFASLATAVARHAAALRRAPYKVLALDCDETLWDGICGEVGPEGVEITPARAALQRFAVEQARAGVLLCLCSKNAERSVFAVFDAHPDMPLRREHLAAWRIDWRPKSENLRSLATELGLGLDAFVFLDDDPAECAEVAARCPEVLSLQLPADPMELPAFLDHVWPFDRLQITEDDRQRGARYRENREREGHRAAASSLADFLASLELRIAIEPLDAERVGRAAQLSQRTNQFNLTTRRFTEAEIARLPEGQGWTVSVSDRFGDHGLVGLMIAEARDHALHVQAFLLSCRVLGKGVEHAMLARLGSEARERDLDHVSLSYVPTLRSAPALDFLESAVAPFGVPAAGGSDSIRRFEVPAAAAAAAVFRPAEAAAPAAASAAEPAADPDARWRARRLARIARDLRQPERVLAASRASRRARTGAGLAAVRTAPRTPTEAAVAEIWCDLLQLGEIGVHDDFLELGGHSLLATQVLSRIHRAFGVRLALREAFEASTVAALAECVEAARAECSAEPSRQAAAAPVLERVAPGAPPVLSFAQERLWFLDQLEPESDAYNLPAQVRLSGALDVAALERALGEIERRHAVLRTAFPGRDGRAVPVARPPAPVALRVVDLTGAPETANAWAHAEAHRPFDLARGPVWRTALLRCAPREHLLLLTLHHIACDGWSSAVLVRELSALYRAFAAGRPSPLAELAVQYADFAAWQRACLDGASGSEQIRYWRQALAGAPPFIELPTDRARPAVRRGAGARRTRALPAALTAGVRALGERHHATLYMTLLAAFQALLARYADSEDFSVGSAIANRTRAELEDLIGFFVNTLVLRADVAGDPSFVELLARTRNRSLGAFAHQDLPFERLVEELQPQRDLRRTPLFQVAFELQNAPVDALELPGLVARATETPLGTSKYELMLTLAEAGEALTATLEYDTELFDADSVDRMLLHFEVLLHGVVAHPDCRLSRLGLLPRGEREALLAEWSRGACTDVGDLLVHRRFEAQAGLTPHAPALVDGDRTLDYRALDERANQLAHHLQALGVGPDVPVALCLERGAEQIVAVLAVLKAGGAYLPLDPGWPAERVATTLDDAGAPLLLTAESQVAQLPQTRARIVCLDRDAGAWAAAPRTPPHPDLHGDHLAYVIYTSGSTGRPKGVAVRHRGLANHTHNASRAWSIGPTDRVLQFASLSFDAAAEEIFPALASGAALVLRGDTMLRSPGQFLARCAGLRITLLDLPTAWWHLLCTALASGEAAGYEALRLVVIGGERAAPEQLARWSEAVGGVRLVNSYGPTEATIVATMGDAPTDEAARAEVTIGTPNPNVDVFVVDRAGQPVPAGVGGELWIGGAGLARGYLGRPNLTAERFVPHPFSSQPGARLYRTGDRVRFRADGRLEFLGRVDQQLKIRGHRIEPGEIEAVLRRHKAVEDVVVIDRPDAHGDARLVAYAVPARPEVGDAGEAALRGDRVRQWQAVFDDLYRELDPQQTVRFYVKGWESSYTGQPIADDEVRAWMDQTVERILAQRPRRVLELGCGGSGLMLFRLASQCESYCATDLAENALRIVRHQWDQAGDAGANVRFVQRPADDFSGVAPGSFDTVLIVSVAQYFPSLDYLTRVIEGAARAVAPGGCIFVGDVRSFDLLETFHADVALQRAPAADTRARLRERVRQRAQSEEQLVVAPAFFEQLGERIPSICGVEIQLERGRHHNELTRFRYDVVLHVGAPGEASATEVASWLRWDEAQTNPAALRARLESEAPPLLGVTGVPNARTAGAALALRALRGDGAADDAAALRNAVVRAEGGVEPEDFWALTDSLPYRVAIRFTDDRDDGRYDVVFRRSDVARGTSAVRPPLMPSALPVRSARTRAYANAPLQARLAERLVPELRDLARAALPDYMVPAAFAVVPALPLTTSGKLDRRALPDPDARRAVRGELVAPRSPVETALCEIWRDVLGLHEVGVHDDFFDLGGHSLLATRVVSRVRETLGVELPLRALFEGASVAALAEAVEAARAETLPRPPPIRRAPRDAPLPLSFAQERLWLLEQLEEGADVYGDSTRLRLTGALDLRLLERALSDLVERHEILRTRFTLGRAGPVQQPVAHAGAALRAIDLRALPPAARDAALERLAAAEAREPFELDRGRLMRVSVLRTTDDESVVLFSLHHIASDAWSMPIFVAELSALYTAAVRGGAAELSPLPIQYADFAQWQRDWLREGALERLLDHWRRQLGGEPPPDTLPTDRPRPAVETLHMARERRTLAAELQPLRAFCRRESATPFMVLLGALDALLARTGGTTDVRVGTDVANRNRAETEGLIGFFVNILVLRTRLDGNPSFREIVQRVKATALGAYAHQDLPFARLVQELQPARRLGRTPLFQVLFVMENAPGGTLSLPGIAATPPELHAEQARFDLALFARETGDGIRLDWNYKSDLFDAETIAKLADRLDALLAHALAEPDTRLDALEPDQTRAAAAEAQRAQQARRARLTAGGRRRRHAVDLAALQVVEMGPVADGLALPWCVQPASADADLVDWAASNRDAVEHALHEHGALLFRGFDLPTAAHFERFAAALDPALFAEYGDLPPEAGSDRVYHSTPYPADKMIRFHNESSHLDSWPRKQWFYCEKAPERGGETPLVDCRRVYVALPADLRERFERVGLLYTRHFTDVLDVRWQDFFRTDDRAAVEARCRAERVEFEWTSAGGLKTRKRGPAVLRHPLTSERVFFNQLQVHHVSCLEPEYRRSLEDLFDAGDLPRNVAFGDGQPIPDAVVDEIVSLYASLAVAVPWQAGDVLMLDNMLVAHGRNPFAGERKILVALAEMVRSADVWRP